jgi:hypothetical protein
LKGQVEMTKWYLIAVAAHNLGRILRKPFGIGKPQRLRGESGDHALRTLTPLLVVAVL